MTRGRPKTFDRDEALASALELFWQRGYSATGIGDLTQHMGIGRQSLYNTFGDKHTLYLEALRSYTEGRLSHAREVLEGEGSPLANLQAFFSMWREEGLTSNCGCMMVNCSTEIGDVDDAAARIIENSQNRLETLFRDLLERARVAGELPESVQPRAFARLILSTANGLAARSRLGLTEDMIDDVLGTLLAVLSGGRIHNLAAHGAAAGASA